MTVSFLLQKGKVEIFLLFNGHAVKFSLFGNGSSICGQNPTVPWLGGEDEDGGLLMECFPMNKMSEPELHVETQAILQSIMCNRRQMARGYFTEMLLCKSSATKQNWIFYVDMYLCCKSRKQCTGMLCTKNKIISFLETEKGKLHKNGDFMYL